MNAYNYFEPIHFVWEWDENKEFILFERTTVLLNKQHVEEILKDLLPIGFPDFTALLFTIAASNKFSYEIVKSIILEREEFHESNWDSFAETCSKAGGFLEKIKELPNEYKQTDSMKQMLSTVFCNSHNHHSKKQSSLYFDYFKGGFNQMKIVSNKKEEKIDDTITILSLLNDRYPTTQSIIDDILSIPEIEEEIELQTIEQAEKQTTEEYLEDLEDKNQTFQVGTLVKTLWAGLKLPVQSAKPSEQPIGGVSDLDNKGDLSQLLISEFANEDILFLSRLANNEALYLRREAPPQENDTKRIFLIDVSLKNWGVPKILSFATMLAMALHPKNKSECEAYIIGEDYKKVDFTDIKDLIKGLQIVDAGIDCSQGLHDYFKNEAQWHNAEHILLTENSTDDSSNFALALSEYRSKIKYKVLTDHDGKIDLYKNLPNQRRHIQQLQIPYERLWKERRRKQKPKQEKTVGREGDNRYIPVLVAPQKKTKERMVTDAGNLYLLTKEGDLLRRYFTGKPYYEFAHDAKGFEVIYTNLNVGSHHIVGEHSNGEVLFLQYSAKTEIATVTNLNTKEKFVYEMFSHNKGQTPKFVFKDNQFYILYKLTKCLTLEGGKISVMKDEDLKTHRLYSYFASQSQRHLHYNSDTSVLKNVRHVFINSQGQLQFNKHAINKRDYPDEALGLFNYDETPEEGQIIAEEIGEKHYQFPDGSQVIVHSAGFTECISADPITPSFFFPMALDWHFSISTTTQCHSHSWFSNSGAVKITLSGFISEISEIKMAIETVYKTLNIKSGYSGAYIDFLMSQVNNGNAVVLPFAFTEESANEFTKKCQVDTDLTVTTVHKPFVDQIGREKFIEDIYQPFIDNIVNHGA